MEAGEHDNKYGGTEDQRTDQTSDNEGGNGDSGAAFPPFQQPAGRARNPPAIESAEKPSTWRKRGTDLPGFPTFRQAPGQSRNPPPIGMLKTPSSRETIGRRRGKAGHAAAAR